MEQGVVYPVEIEIWPHSRIWHKGEKLTVEITGNFPFSGWYQESRFDFQDDNGDGLHVVHTGGQYQSYLQIPVIPPKYVSGDFIVR